MPEVPHQQLSVRGTHSGERFHAVSCDFSHELQPIEGYPSPNGTAVCVLVCVLTSEEEKNSSKWPVDGDWERHPANTRGARGLGRCARHLGQNHSRDPHSICPGHHRARAEAARPGGGPRYPDLKSPREEISSLSAELLPVFQVRTSPCARLSGCPGLCPSLSHDCSEDPSPTVPMAAGLFRFCLGTVGIFFFNFTLLVGERELNK